jgi:ribose transport system substrate-binding protein
MKNTIIHVLLAAMLISVLQCDLFTQEKLKIAVVPKSKSALFWKSTLVGARLGALAVSGVEILWTAPLSESDKEQQISIVEQCIADNVSGIILSPIHQDALAGSVSKAMKKKIPVIIFDSPLKGVPGKDFICYIGIDNKKAGYRAGEHLAKLIGNRGKVVMLRYVKGQANTTEREEGFLEAMAKHQNIQVTMKDQYTGGTVDEAKKVCKNLLSQIREADGIFCTNELSTIGMLFTLQEANITGKIKFVGFDTPAPAVEALKKGEIDALIAQDPSRMGYFGVKTIVDHIRGKKVPTKINIDVSIVTRENLNDPNIQKLLSLPSISE